MATRKSSTRSLKLLRQTELERAVEMRFDIAALPLKQAAHALQSHPEDPEAQRHMLRLVFGRCYPSYLEVWLERGGAPVPAFSPARQGLESVLYAVDHTRLVDVWENLDQRLHFLNALNAALGPFRKLKSGESVDLHKAFDFSTMGRGKRSPDKTNATRAAWESPCLEVQLLRMAGVKTTSAIARVAAAPGRDVRDVSALRKAYTEWKKDPIRSELLRRGDPFAKKWLADSHLESLIKTAFPPVPVPIRPHR